MNIVWGLLEANLSEADMEVLRKEEKEWIAFKDAEVQAAGQECEGGSIQPSVEASRAADLTKARVYELAEYASEGEQPLFSRYNFFATMSSGEFNFSCIYFCTVA